MAPKFYLTTPLYYVNDIPHIGHAYTTIAADVLARYKRQQGFDVHFLTGTDEHGQKVWKTAQDQGKDARQFVDSVVGRYKTAWQTLGISYDDFIRTTDARHEKTVQAIFRQLSKQGDIYKGFYEGWYCVACETYWAEGETNEDLEGRKLCPTCGRLTDLLKEESYFFRQSKYQEKLLKHIEENQNFIEPISRRNEVMQFIKQGLRDLSVTRTAFPWGIAVPDDPKHVIYVWFDALINYISAIGYPDNQPLFEKWWPADVHLMGKEIVRFHAITWSCMLFALGIPLPQKIFGHGWWTVEGKKMSKSKGNVVDPLVLSSEFGVEAVRYFILREVPFGADGDFSQKALVNRYNADLANDLGNLLSRTLTMVEKYFDAKIPVPTIDEQQAIDQLSRELADVLKNTPKLIDQQMENLAFSEALESIWRLIALSNVYIEKQAPWSLAKKGEKGQLALVLNNLIQVLNEVAQLISPFMPKTSLKILAQLNLEGDKIAKGDPLFPRIVK